jgi:hypothetical protein
MSWTVACFCGTVFESPTDRCPNCHTPVPEVTTTADPAKSVPLPDGVAEHLPDVDQTRTTATRQ